MIFVASNKSVIVCSTLSSVMGFLCGLTLAISRPLNPKRSGGLSGRLDGFVYAQHGRELMG